MADSDDDELADAIRELTQTLEALRTELEGSHRRRGPRLRPPTPRDVLDFADTVAIPTALTVLKSSIRALEAFQRGIDLVRTEREVRDKTSEASAVASDRADEVRRTTLSRLDTVLSELQRAASSGALPADEEARDLLTEARTLRDDVDARLREATSQTEPTESDTHDSTPVEIDIDDGTPDSQDDSDENEDRNPGSAVDVDAELETLKDQYAEDEDENEDDRVDTGVAPDDERDGDGNGNGDETRNETASDTAPSSDRTESETDENSDDSDDDETANGI